MDKSFQLLPFVYCHHALILFVSAALSFNFLLLCAAEFMLSHLCPLNFIALHSALITVPSHTTDSQRSSCLVSQQHFLLLLQSIVT